MPDPSELRDRAALCRLIARDYHPAVGRPLYQKARQLEREASQIDRSGIERRGLSASGTRGTRRH